jgi:hypothetical protein
MKRSFTLIASIAINAATISAVAAGCAPIKDIDASRSRWEILRSQAAEVTDKEKVCRAYAAAFYESVTLRQVATTCSAGERNLAVLDSEINAFNDLLAMKCGG